jgi:acyl-CoA thioester hydrolase
MAALEQITKYKAEVMAGELLVIKSKVLEVGDKTIRFIHTMYNAETEDEVATTELVAVHLDRKKRKGCSLPDDIRSKCEEMIQK